MAKEVLPVTCDSSQALDVPEILRKSFSLPFRNGKLMVSITLLVLLPFTLLVSLHNLVAGPLIEEVEDLEPDEGLSRFHKDAGVLLVLEAAFLLAFSVVSLFGMMTTIYYSAITYMGKSMSLNELLLRTTATWKRLVITWLYFMIFTVAYVLIVVVSIATFVLVTRVHAMATWISLVGCLAAVFYLYLAIVWTLGLVISVVEEDCYGVKAIVKAGELIRGRKVQGFVLMLFLLLLSGPISIVFYLSASDDDLGVMARFALGSVVTVLFCIVKLFTYVVYTVFYYECKKSYGEKVDIEMGKGTGYSLVPANIHSNASLPP